MLWYGRGSWLPEEKKAYMWPGRGSSGGSWPPAFPRSLSWLIHSPGPSVEFVWRKTNPILSFNHF